MIATLLKGLQSLSEPQLTMWANQLHSVTVPLMATVWCWPLIVMLFRKLHNSSPDIEWVSLWRCPRCSTFNRRAMLDCSHCEYHLKIGGFAKWIPLKLSEFYKRTRRQILLSYRLLGWTIFYGITALTFWRLRLYSFQQAPIQEFLACVAMLMVLLALLFFRRALVSWVLSPLGATMDAFAGLVVVGLFGLVLTLWSAAPYPAGTPLGYISTQSNGWVDLQRAGYSAARGQGSPTGTTIRFDLHYGVIYWPQLGYRQVVLTRVAGKPLLVPWKMTAIQQLARWLKNDRYLHPKWVSLNQTLSLAPGIPSVLLDAYPAPGLLVRPVSNLETSASNKHNSLSSKK